MLEETDSWFAHPRFLRRTSFANYGEQMAAKAFDDALTASRDSWTRVLCSALVAGENQPPREADFIIVNRYGLTVVEVKWWIGETIFGRQGECFRDGKPEPDPRTQARDTKDSLMSLIDWQRRVNPQLPHPVAVNAVVVFVGRNAQFSSNLDRHGIVRSLDAAVRMILSGDLPHKQSRQHVLTPTSIEQLKDAIWGISPQQFRRRVGDFTLENEQHKYNRPGVECPAHRSDDGRSEGEAVWLVRHQTGFVETTNARDRARAAARRDYDALVKLEDVPGIPRPRHFFADPNDDTIFWTAHKRVPGGPLMQRRSVPLLPSLVQIAETLAACHKVGVYHRQLSPSCLWWSEANNRPLILRWDLSRITGQSTVASFINEQLRESCYSAPEIRDRPSAANAVSDIYSLGVTALELLTGEQLPDATENSLEKLAACVASTKLRTLLSDMVQQRPSNRPQTMESVAKILDSSK